jgi:acetyl esterase
MKLWNSMPLCLAAGFIAFQGAPALADAAPSAAAQATAAELAVRPDVQAFLDNAKAHPRPPMTPEVLAMIRKMPPNTMPSSDLPVGQLGEIRDVTMPGPAGAIKLRLFDPRSAADRKPGPVVVFYHGGGFVVGSIDTHAGFTAEMARALDLPVVSVEYRLAPESPFPAATDDADAATRWIADNGKAFGREFTGLVLSGDSAGGSLTLVEALALRDKPARLPVLMQFPIYPASDLGGRYRSGALFGKGYAGPGGEPGGPKEYAADVKDWRASPLLADLTGVAPMLLVTAGLDALRDQGRAYAAKAIEAGVPTTYYEAKGTIHGFATYRKAIPSARDDVARMFELAKAMLAQVSAQK